MNKLILELYNIDVCTINKAYYRNGNRTKEARAYSESVQREMVKHKTDIIAFQKSFNSLDDSEKELSLNIEILVPQGRMYTKSGSIHINSIDIDNYLKLLIDAVMDKRYNGREFKDGSGKIYNLDMNDKYITRLYASKAENPNPNVSKWDLLFTLEII